MASQTASHFDRRELNGLSRIYECVNVLKVAAPRELDVWTSLYSVVGPGRTKAPAEIAIIRRDIGEARLFDQLITIRVRQIADREHLEYDRDFVQNRSAPSARRSLCSPIPAQTPPGYGHAPVENAIQQALIDPLRGPA